MRDKAYKARVEDLGNRKLEAHAARNWLEAERLVRQILQLLPKKDYRIDFFRTDICDYLLYRGKLDQAKSGYLQLSTVPNGMEEVSAYSGLARIAAELGDFPDALQWVDRYERAFGSGCGNCIEGRRTQAHALRTVWRAAKGGSPEAALRRIIAGNFQPLPGRLYKGTEDSQRKAAAQEARLILAEFLIRQKRISEGRALLQELMSKTHKDQRTEDELFILAEYHLKQIS